MDGYSTKIKKGYRTVWISDLHLGTSGCKSELLLDFLKQIKTYTLENIKSIDDLNGCSILIKTILSFFASSLASTRS